MRQLLAALGAAVGLAAAGAGAAAPSVEIRGAVAQVVLVPEARPDIKVVVLKANPGLPLRVSKFGARTFVSGGLARRIGACGSQGGQPTVLIGGLGVTPLAAMPYVAIHTPMNVRLFVEGAVWGKVGRADALEFSNAGCGDWVIANVRGRMRLSLAGGGGARTGNAGYAELYSAGAGAISTRTVTGGVIAVDAGAGSINIGEVDGPFTARVAGAGAVRAAAGRVSQMLATIAGAGGVTLDGVAGSLNASIVGSGDVKVARVTGPVIRSVIGSGKVQIGS